MSDNQIPVILLAAELNTGVDKLMDQLDGQIGFDPATGLRVISAATCRRLVDEHARAAQAKAERERQRRAQLKASLAELGRKHPLRDGTPAQPNSTAYADMLAVDQR